VSERRWADRWERDGVYRWDRTKGRAETFSVDTPPLTVSGSLHIGHAFSFTQADILVRFQRMTGKNIAYPIGWDDNGLATERRVQNVFGIRPDPRKPYDPSWRPTKDKPKDAPVEEVSRQNFIEACALVTAEDERAFEAVWRRVGLSVDWSTQYATIDARCRRVSQLSFLDLVRKGEVYQKFAPTVWDADDHGAVQGRDRGPRGRRVPRPCFPG
jgi:valyl-tRNA synthetase